MIVLGIILGIIAAVVVWTVVEEVVAFKRLHGVWPRYRRGMLV